MLSFILKISSEFMLGGGALLPLSHRSQAKPVCLGTHLQWESEGTVLRNNSPADMKVCDKKGSPWAWWLHPTHTHTLTHTHTHSHYLWLMGLRFQRSAERQWPIEAILLAEELCVSKRPGHLTFLPHESPSAPFPPFIAADPVVGVSIAAVTYAAVASAAVWVTVYQRYLTGSLNTEHVPPSHLAAGHRSMSGAWHSVLILL